MNRIDRSYKILALALGLGFLIYISRGLLMPLVFAIFISLFTYPIYTWFLKKVKNNFLSVILSFLTLILPISILFLIIYDQLLQILSSIPDIKSKLLTGINNGKTYLSEVFNINLAELDAITDNLTSDLSGPLAYLSDGLTSTTSFLLNSALCLLYSYFLLYYSQPFKYYFISQFKPTNRGEVSNIINSIRDTIRSYIGGLGIVILILAVMNSLGLWIIGVDYAIFFGILAGCLAVIPYIGTFLGGVLPFIYCLATFDHSWQPIAVVGYYILIQQIEGNLITPNIVGDKVDVNPFFAILSIIFMGSIFGIAGVILAIPFVSIVKIIFSHIEPLEPTSVLLSSKLSESSELFQKKYSNKRYSILSFFRKDEKDH